MKLQKAQYDVLPKTNTVIVISIILHIKMFSCILARVSPPPTPSGCQEICYMTLTVGHLLLLFPFFGEEGILWYQIAPFKILKESGRNII